MGFGVFVSFKPSQHPEPPGVQSLSDTDVQNTAASYTDAKKEDLLWTLGHLHKADGAQQMIPAWTGFNSTLSDRNLPRTTIRYMPFIRASPSDFSPIYTILIRLVEI